MLHITPTLIGTYEGSDKKGWFTLNDVWATKDGVMWTACTKNATWRGRIWAGAAVFQGEMFVLFIECCVCCVCL